MSATSRSTSASGWRLVPLEEVCEVILGQSPPGSTYNTQGDGLAFFQGKAEFGDLYPTPSKWCTAPKKIAEPDDVLISVRAPVGPTNLCPEKACIGRGLAALRARPGVPSRYVLYALRATQARLEEQATGSTFAAVSGSTLRAHSIPLAPEPQRQQIVEEIEKQLTRLEAGVAALKRVQANLKRYRAAVLAAACEGRLVPTEAALARQAGRSYEPASILLERIKAERAKVAAPPRRGTQRRDSAATSPSDLPPLPEGWAWATLGQVAWDASYGTSVKCAADPSGTPVVRIPNVQSARLDWSDLKYAPSGLALADGEELRPGDMLVIRTNGSKSLLGRCAIVRESIQRATFASYLIRFRLVEVPSLWSWLGVMWHAEPLRRWIESRAASSAGQHNISMTVLSGAPLPVPPLAEQHRIVAEVERRLSLADDLERAVAANLDRATRLRQSILAAAFTGRLET